jgi:surface protein
MFRGAAAFNQDISGWNVARVNSCSDFCNNAGFSVSPAVRRCGTLGFGV